MPKRRQQIDSDESDREARQSSDDNIELFNRNTAVKTSTKVSKVVYESEPIENTQS